MSKKNVSLIEQGVGFFQGLVTNLMDVAREENVPFGAVYRLATPVGRSTLKDMVGIAYRDWLRKNPTRGSHDGTVLADKIAIPFEITASDIIELLESAYASTNTPIKVDPELWHLIKRELDLVRGKTLRVHIHDFDKEWETQEARAWQTDRKADGNVAALFFWASQTEFRKWMTTIPNDYKRLSVHEGSQRYTAGIGCMSGKWEADFDAADEPWEKGTSLVTFSEVV